jgi:predicted GNAT superfamily acetyltransferase
MAYAGAAMPAATDLQVVVRDIHGADELRMCQVLQRHTWGITEDGYVVPVATMAAAQKMGGLVLGAFDASGGLLGFSFAFLGRLDDKLVLYSQLAAVEPAAQSHGVGRRLKLEQRRRAQQANLDAVVWAFDPLQASNAAFNLGVLGATCRRYEVDMYGSRTDALNAGLATDRLLAEWPTRSEPRPVAEDWPEAPDLVQTDIGSDGLRVPVGLQTADAPRVRIEIPAHLATTKQDPTVAQAWQRHVRAAFTGAFAGGYTAVGFSRADASRPRYLLHTRT